MSKPYEHVVSVSGGVDSGATFLKAIERGRPFRAMFADTCNEDQAVYDPVLDAESTDLGSIGIHEKVEWSKTSRGGRQYDLDRMLDRDIKIGDFNTPCNQWGACESA